MAMVILNPTDEEIKVTWGGQNYTLKPDSREKVDDSMGRQIVHNYGNRGLVSLEYGDEGEIELKKIKEGRAKNDEFWTRQCVNYNQLNEQREQSHRPFLKPSKEVQDNARRLGIKLLEPYKLEDAGSKQLALLIEQNASLQKELKKKDSALDTLKDQVGDLTENFKNMMQLAGAKPQGDNTDKDYKAIAITITKMSKKRFLTWMTKHWTEIQSYPDEVKKDIADKHEKLYNAPFPVDRPVVENYDVA